MTDISVTLIFLLIGSTGLLALCSLFDDRVEGPLKRVRPFVRFFFSSISAALVCLGLILWLIYGFPDPDQLNPNDPPPTVCNRIVCDVAIVAMWPLVAVAWILGGDPPLMPLWFSLPGLFWGFVVEMLFVLRKRRGSNSA